MVLPLQIGGAVILLDGPAVDGFGLGASQRQIRSGQHGFNFLAAAELGQPRVTGALQLVLILIVIEGHLQILPQQMGRNIGHRLHQNGEISPEMR